MAAEIRKSLEQILECPICQEQLRDATLLKCGHSFCKECLNRLVSSEANSREANGIGQTVMTLPCPCCRKGVRIENRSLGSLKPNLMVNSIVDALNRPSTSGGSSSKSHSKSRTKKKSNVCEKHPKIEKRYVCERCKVCICSECAISEHFNHDGCRPKTLEEITHIVTDILDESDCWELNHSAFESQVDYIKGKGVKVLEKLDKELHAEYRRRVCDLSEAKEKLASYLQDQKRKFTEQIDSLLLKEQEAASRVTENRLQAINVLKRGAPTDVINAYTTFAKRLKTELRSDVPSTRAAVTKLKAINALYFERGESDVDKTLGRIRHRGGDGESDEEMFYEDNSDRDSVSWTVFSSSPRDGSLDDRSDGNDDYSSVDLHVENENDRSSVFSEADWHAGSHYEDEGDETVNVTS